ncbi:MAG TPA: hypothetical protein PLD87_10125 [Bacteroidia bacterium]|nr:hypothetical protein [Bacteroidia bacterium]
MSEKDNLNAISEKIDRLFLIIEGKDNHGIEGLVPMLQRHMKESSEKFDTFKTTIVSDNIRHYKHFDERIKPLEKAQKDSARNLGIAGGLALVFGYFASELKDFFGLFK